MRECFSCQTFTQGNGTLQSFVTDRLEDVPGEFCGEEAGEQRGEKLKPGWMG